MVSSEPEFVKTAIYDLSGSFSGASGAIAATFRGHQRRSLHVTKWLSAQSLIMQDKLAGDNKKEFIMEKIIRWFLEVPEETPSSVFLIRLMAGGVFFWEGLIKFVFANQG